MILITIWKEMLHNNIMLSSQGCHFCCCSNLGRGMVLRSHSCSLHLVLCHPFPLTFHGEHMIYLFQILFLSPPQKKAVVFDRIGYSFNVVSLSLLIVPVNIYRWQDLGTQYGNYHEIIFYSAKKSFCDIHTQRWNAVITILQSVYATVAGCFYEGTCMEIRMHASQKVCRRCQKCSSHEVLMANANCACSHCVSCSTIRQALITVG